MPEIELAEVHNHGRKFTSTFYGVSWHKSSQRWAVQIRHDGKRIHVGYYPGEIEAAKAYDQIAIRLRGDVQTTRLNFDAAGHRLAPLVIASGRHSEYDRYSCMPTARPSLPSPAGLLSPNSRSQARAVGASAPSGSSSVGSARAYPPPSRTPSYDGQETVGGESVGAEGREAGGGGEGGTGARTGNGCAESRATSSCASTCSGDSEGPPRTHAHAAGRSDDPIERAVAEALGDKYRAGGGYGSGPGTGTTSGSGSEVEGEEYDAQGGRIRRSKRIRASGSSAAVGMRKAGDEEEEEEEEGGGGGEGVERGEAQEQGPVRHADSEGRDLSREGPAKRGRGGSRPGAGRRRREDGGAFPAGDTDRAEPIVRAMRRGAPRTSRQSRGTGRGGGGRGGRTHQTPQCTIPAGQVYYYHTAYPMPVPEGGGGYSYAPHPAHWPIDPAYEYECGYEYGEGDGEGEESFEHWAGPDAGAGGRTSYSAHVGGRGSSPPRQHGLDGQPPQDEGELLLQLTQGEGEAYARDSARSSGTTGFQARLGVGGAEREFAQAGVRIAAASYSAMAVTLTTS